MTDFVPPAAAPSGGAWTWRFNGSLALAPAFASQNRILFPAKTKTLANRPASLLCVDSRTTQLLWEYSMPGTFTTPPTVDGELLFIGNREFLCAIDLTTHGDLWYPYGADGIISQPVVVGDLVIFGTSTGRNYALDKNTKAERWYGGNAAFTSGVRVARIAPVGDCVVIALSKGSRSNVSAMKTATGQILFNEDVGRQITTDPVVVGSNIYYGCADGQLVGFSVPDGALVMDVTVGRSRLNGPLATDGEYLYAGGEDGNFYARAIDPASELLQWELPITARLPHGVVVHNGEAFFSGENSDGKAYFYMLDLLSAEEQTPKDLVEAVTGLVQSPPALYEGRIGFTASGASSGTLYVVDSSEVAMLSRVTFSSRLIVGDYDLTDGTPRRPEFQMLITVTDTNDLTQDGVAVAIWASKEATIDGEAVGVTEETAIHRITDANGQIALTMDGDLGTPSLYLRPDFFAEGYSLQVFPDQETVLRLSTVQATAPADGDPRLGLTNATGYDGQPVLKPEYSSSVEDVASTIRNTVGEQQNVSTTRITKPASGTTRSMSGPAAAATRGIAPGGVPHFIVDFDYAATSLRFMPSSPEEIDAMVRAVPATRGLGGTLHHYVHEVTDGAKKVKKLTWKHVEEAGSKVVHVTADVIDEAGNLVEQAYAFVVATVEEAIEVLKGVIKEIVSAIQSFIEWLSWLFDWDDILATKHDIRNLTLDLMNKARGWAGDPAVQAGVKNALVSLREGIDAKFEAAIESLTGKTLSSAQQSVPSKHETVHPHGVDITGQINWLIRKLPHPSLVTLHVPKSAEDKLLGAANSMFVAMDALLATPAFQQLPQDLEKVVADFLKLFEGTSDGILQQTLADIAAVVEDVLNLFFDFLIALVEPAFAALGECIDALIAMLDAKIDLGFITDFYESLGGGELKLLDAVALVLAVPVTLTRKIVEGKKGAAATRAHEHGWDPVYSSIDLTGAFGYLFYGGAALAEISFEKAEFPFGVNLANAVQGVMNVIVTAAGSFELLEDPNRDDFSTNVFFTLFQLVTTAVNFYVWTIRNDVAAKEAWEEGRADFVWTFLGTASLGLSGLYAVVFPEDYRGKDGLIVGSNLGTSLPYFTPLMPSFKWEVVLNGIGYLIGLGTSFAFAFNE